MKTTLILSAALCALTATPALAGGEMKFRCVKSYDNNKTAFRDDVEVIRNEILTGWKADKTKSLKSPGHSEMCVTSLSYDRDVPANGNACEVIGEWETAAVLLCGPKGYGVHCDNLAKYAGDIIDKCKGEGKSGGGIRTAGIMDHWDGKGEIRVVNRDVHDIEGLV